MVWRLRTSLACWRLITHPGRIRKPLLSASVLWLWVFCSRALFTADRKLEFHLFWLSSDIHVQFTFCSLFGLHSNSQAFVYIVLYQLWCRFWIWTWSCIATHLVVLLLLVGATLQKSLMLRHFKLDRDGIWQDCSSSKYASIDGVGFAVWCRTFKVVAMTSFSAENCCHVMSAHTVSTQHICSSIRQLLILLYIHTSFFLIFTVVIIIIYFSQSQQ